MTAFVDTHFHLWDLGRFRYPWLDDPGGDQFAFDYVLDDWRRDVGDADLVATVHVQAEMDHAADPLAETAWLAELRAQGDPATPTVCVGYADLRAADLEDVLDRHMEYDFFRGIRQELWYDPASQRSDVLTHNLLDDPAWPRGLEQLAARELTFDLLAWPSQLAQAAEVFRRVPELVVVLEHLGLPPADPNARVRWRAALERFADEVPSSWLKISALSFLSPHWDADQIGVVVKEALEVFGPQRCLLGSNFPVDRPAVGYRELWQDMEWWTEHLSPDEQHWVRVENALQVYRIDTGAAS
ncbi:amidohydrolase family protein [Kribbella sp. NPDC048915]|uniref:amidohydrolase family protein n=1 Tax=Kribbella sp. NPDC048915 TaxID=3155148 RepID=UPI0033EEE7C8